MDPRFAIVEKTYYRRDRFDLPLDGYLFDAIQYLRVIESGEHPIWKAVVAEILSTYFIRIHMDRLSHFKLSYGNPEREKSKRQVDFEEHISMLQDTAARPYISKVCIEALQGRAWQATQKLRRWKWTSFLRPRVIFFQILSIPTVMMFRLMSWGNRLGFPLEILGLFHSLTDEEFDAILVYLQKIEGDKWKVSYFSNLFARTGMLSPAMLTRLENFIFSCPFERKDVELQVLARLSRISTAFLDRLTEVLVQDKGYLTRDVVEILLTSAAANPKVMGYWLSESAQFEGYFFSSMEDSFQKKLGSVEQASLEVVFDFAENGTPEQGKLAETMLRNIQQITHGAQRYLAAALKTGSLKKRYLAACVINGLAVYDRFQIGKVFDSLLDAALGPVYLDASNQAYQARDEFEKKILELLLEMSRDRPDLLEKLLRALRERWAAAFAQIISRVFADTEFESQQITVFAAALQAGEIASCRALLDENRARLSPARYAEITEGLETVERDDMLGYVLHDQGTPAQGALAWACLGYLFRVWPSLVTINSKLSELPSTNPRVIAALLCLKKPSRSEWKSAPVYKHEGDSYTVICADIGRAIDVIHSANDDLLVDILVEYSNTQHADADVLIRALSYFSRADPRLVEILKAGITEAYTGRPRAFPWQNMDRLSAEEVSLVIKDILDDSVNPEILKKPHTIDAAGAAILIDAIKKRSELAENDVKELWLFIYAIKTLVHSSAITEELIQLCKDILEEKVWVFDEKHSRDVRPYAVWVLSRVRPFRPDIYYFLKGMVTSGPSQLIAYGHHMWTKVAAMIALAELGSDITNGLSWAEREDIADLLIKFIKVPFQTDFHLFGGENIFPDKPSDAVYEAARMIVETVRKYWAKTDYVVADNID